MIRFALRISEELYAALKKVASMEQRSINEEILYILKLYISQFNKKQS
jgi:hypothetical protein